MKKIVLHGIMFVFSMLMCGVVIADSYRDRVLPPIYDDHVIVADTGIDSVSALLDERAADPATGTALSIVNLHRCSRYAAGSHGLRYEYANLIGNGAHDNGEGDHEDPGRSV